RAADGDPDRQRTFRPRIDAATGNAGRVLGTRPVQLPALAQLEQQRQLFSEEVVVIVEVVAEQRKGFDEGAAARHDLRAAAGEQVEGGRLLTGADRVIR